MPFSTVIQETVVVLWPEPGELLADHPDDVIECPSDMEKNYD